MGSISILLADDSITIQKVVGIIFGSDDYSLTVVDNGKAAVQKAQEVRPDVLLIDALMPGMDGYEVCEAIRKDALLASKPILMLTGSFEPFDEDKARQCGADDHIVKPFESQQIVAKVQELYQLGQKRAVGAAPAPVAAATEELMAAAPAPAPAEEPFAFEQTSFAAVPEILSAPEPSAFFTAPVEPEPEETFVVPAIEPEPVRSQDDPWGAFTQQPAVESFAGVADAPAPSPFADNQTDVMALMSDEPSADQPHKESIGSSWVPVEEQTFEFREEAVETPAASFDVAAAFEPEPTFAPEPAFTPEVAFTSEASFQPEAFEAVPVVEQVADIPPQAVAPVVVDDMPLVAPAAGAVALTEAQLKEALLAASKETIERIVWEVVPDLAEAMIKEAIKRITEGK